MSAGPDRQLNERMDNVSASFDALDSDSDTDSNGDLETDENMKVILSEIQRNVKQTNKTFDKMKKKKKKKTVKDVKKSNSELKKLNAELKQTVNELKTEVGDLEKTVGLNTFKAERLKSHSRRNNLIVYMEFRRNRVRIMKRPKRNFAHI